MSEAPPGDQIVCHIFFPAAMICIQYESLVAPLPSLLRPSVFVVKEGTWDKTERGFSQTKGPSTHGEEFAYEYSTSIRRRIFFIQDFF